MGQAKRDVGQKGGARISTKTLKLKIKRRCPSDEPVIWNTSNPCLSVFLFRSSLPGVTTPSRAQPTSKCVREEALKADCVLIKFIIGWGLIPVVISRRPKGKQDYSLAIIPMKLLGFSQQNRPDGNRLVLPPVGLLTPSPTTPHPQTHLNATHDLFIEINAHGAEDTDRVNDAQALERL